MINRYVCEMEYYSDFLKYRIILKNGIETMYTVAVYGEEVRSADLLSCLRREVLKIFGMLNHNQDRIHQLEFRCTRNELKIQLCRAIRIECDHWAKDRYGDGEFLSSVLRHKFKGHTIEEIAYPWVLYFKLL